MVRAAVDERRFASAVVGQERRYCALAADDPWARRRSIRLDEVRDPDAAASTGAPAPPPLDLWPAESRPAVEYTQDIDDWLAVIATGRCVGITAEGTVTQYRRDGIVYRPLRDADPVAVRLIWRRHDPHPATHAAVALLTDLYRQALLTWVGRPLPGNPGRLIRRSA